MISSDRSYVYNPLTIEERVEKLKERGLIIDNNRQVEYYLTFVGHHRFSAYYVPFQEDTVSKQFISSTRFSQVVEVYEFDRELRFLIMDAIDHIEVALRTVISTTATDIHGTHWFTDETVLSGSDRKTCVRHIKNAVKKYKEQSNSTVSKYYDRYDEPELPPSWTVFEILTFGNIDFIYRNLKLSTRKQIASKFDVRSFEVFGSWIKTLYKLRNLCAHHSRIWNKSFDSPEILDRFKGTFQGGIPRTHTFFAQAFVIVQMLKPISPSFSEGCDKYHYLIWKNKLETLIASYGSIKESEMGFPEGWQSLPIWK